MKAVYQFHISELNNKFLAYIHTLFKNKQIKVIITDEAYSERSDNKDESGDLIVLSKKSLNRAYTEEEPEYTLNMIKEPNPEYEGR